jgi:nucleotide-binding universal stress UspA family protein
MVVRRSRKWHGFRSVLCAVDFSENSSLALQYAARVALRAGAPLTTLYVNDPLLVAAASAALHDQRFTATSLRELRRFGDAHLRAQDRDGLEVRERVTVGAAADQILKTAKAVRSDLIVLGTKGLTGARRVFMGSTTLSVLQRTSVPVLAISPVSDAGDRVKAPPPPGWPGHTILVAVELDRSARAEIDAAADIGAWLDASLLIVHVLERPSAPSWLTADLTPHQRTRQKTAERMLQAAAARAGKRVSTDVRVIPGDVEEELAAVANAEGIQLAVTMLRERHGWFGAQRGAVSYDLLAHAATPVLAIPPLWRRG